MHFYIEIIDGELLSTSHIDGIVEVHGQGLEGAKRAYAAVMAAHLRERMTENTRQKTAALDSRMFKAQLSKFEQQWKLHPLGSLKIEMPKATKPIFKMLSSDGSELYAGSNLADAVSSLSSLPQNSLSLG